MLDSLQLSNTVMIGVCKVHCSHSKDNFSLSIDLYFNSVITLITIATNLAGNLPENDDAL